MQFNYLKNDNGEGEIRNECCLEENEAINILEDIQYLKEQVQLIENRASVVIEKKCLIHN